MSADDLHTELDQISKELFELREHLRPVVKVGAQPGLTWKTQWYVQAMLRRVIALTEGAVSAWYASNTLAALVLARAVLETVASFYCVASDVVDAAQAGDGERTLSILARATLATRLPERATDETKAVNVQTYVDRLEKVVPGMREHYDWMCEFAHPNFLGHAGVFGQLRVTEQSVVFPDERLVGPQSGLATIIAGLGGLPLFASYIETLEDLHPRLAVLETAP